MKGGRNQVLPAVLSAFLPVLWGLQACSPATKSVQADQTPGVVIRGMIIRNELSFPVTDVLITVPATGRFGGCGNILPGTECNTSFEAMDYSAQQLVVSWKEYGQPHDTGTFKLETPDWPEPDKPAWIEVVIYAMGQAGATLVQP